MTIKPEEKDLKVEKGLEDMTAEEISLRICDLYAKASDAFRGGRNDKVVERIDAEIEKCCDAFEKLTGRKYGEPKD